MLRVKIRALQIFTDKKIYIILTNCPFTENIKLKYSNVQISEYTRMMIHNKIERYLGVDARSQSIYVDRENFLPKTKPGELTCARSKIIFM